MPHGELNGVCPIIATPFTSSEQVDEDSLRNLIRALAAAGCHGLPLFGIASEYYKLSEAEARRMVRITVDECGKGGTPSIISVTQHATKLAVDQAKAWTDAGADALMLLNYEIRFLLPGTYDLAAEFAGFKQCLRKGVAVRIEDEVAIDIVPEPGAHAEGVTVTAEAPRLYTFSGKVQF